MKQGLNSKTLDKVIDSYWNFITDHKLDALTLEQPFVRYTKKGKLIIDLNDFNSCNVNNKNYEFLQILNNLKNQL
jgi:hypothetical protein